ncbi:XylR family transcriptional regulator [Planctomycetota bacterium]|nr:XylR family transcriptional regulator [Planctomycetota bacterium]
MDSKIHIPRVGLLIETARGYGRDFLRGVMRYERQYGPWCFHLTPGDFKQALPYMSDWKWTGLIARIGDDPELEDAIVSAGIPCVLLDLSQRQRKRGHVLSRYAEVHPDAEQIGKIASEYFQNMQLVHYGFVGLHNRIWSTERRKYFSQFLRKYKKKVSSFYFDEQVAKVLDRRNHQIGDALDEQQYRLAEWLKVLDKPIGIMACDDVVGRYVIEACHIADLNVPEDVAVLGVDDDHFFCNLSHPSLSSIALNAEKGGYQAAQLLGEMMQQCKQKKRRIVVDAVGVKTRQSTDFIAVDDPLVQLAVNVINEKSSAYVTIDEIASDCDVSRRNLEMRFRNSLGKTILEVMSERKLRYAMELLQEKDWSISRIAEAVGYQSVSYFTQVFKKRMRITPSNYRLETKRLEG